VCFSFCFSGKCLKKHHFVSKGVSIPVMAALIVEADGGGDSALCKNIEGLSFPNEKPPFFLLVGISFLR